jgi:hypothetical protein
MKTKLIALIGLLTLLSNLSQAQTNTLTQQGQMVVSAVQSSGLLNASNYSVEPYLTYAPKNAANANFGGGILAIYNLNSYVGAGLGVDYLGQFSLVSGNATLKVPINVGKYVVQYAPWLGSGLTNLEVVPFALGGIGTPLSGSPNTIATILDAGAYVQFGHLYGGKFNVGACWGEWANAGDYSGKRYHLFFGWSHGF